MGIQGEKPGERYVKVSMMFKQDEKERFHLEEFIWQVFTCFLDASLCVSASWRLFCSLCKISDEDSGSVHYAYLFAFE